MLELFVTGVDKYSDKIFVTAGITATMQSLDYSTAVYKPVETGIIEKQGFVQSPDLAYVKYIDPFVKTYYTYLLKAHFNPLISAAKEGIVIEKDRILADYQKIQDVNELLIIDGVGGLATPLSKNFLEEDMIKMIDVPLLLVVSAAHSSIDNIILIINHAIEKGINLRGIILTNYPESTDNSDIKLMPRLIEEYTNVKILGILPHFNKPELNPNDLITEILSGIDLEAVLNLRIAKLQL